MGASSSGLLDEAKISHIKGLVDTMFQSFSVFYCQQYSAAYFRHLHQEVEPKKEGRGQLLTQRPQYAPEEVLYQGSVMFSCWDEQGTKCKERYAVLRRDYKVEIHENMEIFNRGCAAKFVLQPAGAYVFTTEEESRAHLEKTCAEILNGVKADSSSVVSSPDVFAVYLHLPYTGHTCFLFQQEEKQDLFLSALKTCIRHCNLDPWCDPSYERQAFVQALRFYLQDKGCYESWEKLLGSEEKVLASQVMEEVLPWLQSQLQSKMKGKKTERIRQWLSTVQATYTLVLEQIISSLETLREKCRQTASGSQALIRSDLDQIVSSHCFLQEKVSACVYEEAGKVCSESVAPYMSSIFETLTENISAGIQGMQQTLHTQMDSALTHTNGGTEETKKALSTLRSISLEQCYRQVENLTGKLEDLQQRFGISSTQRLVHSAHLEMEKLLGSAVYTLELFLQSSARLQPSQVPVKMVRAKERVLKQLDYDSRVVQRRLYEEALLEITLPALTKKMDAKWKSELQQFEQYIFSDYSSFILVHNVYEDILRNIISKEIETVVKDAASKKSNNLLLDTSDLAISQYSLLGQTPPHSAPDSPAMCPRQSSSAAPTECPEPAPVVQEGGQVVTGVSPQNDPELNSDANSDKSTAQGSEQHTGFLSPVIVVSQEFDKSTEEDSCFEETCENVQPESDTVSVTDSKAESSSSTLPDSDVAVTHEVGTNDTPADPESDKTTPDAPDCSVTAVSSPQSTDMSAQSDQAAMTANPPAVDRSTSDQVTEESGSILHPCPSPPTSTDGPVKISLGSLTEAIGCGSAASSVMQTVAQQTTDRAVYLTGEIKNNWELEKQRQAAEEKEGKEKTDTGEAEGTEERDEMQMGGAAQEGGELVDKKEKEEADMFLQSPQQPEEVEERGEGHMGGVAQTGAEPVDVGCQSSESPAESATALITEQGESDRKVDDGQKGGQTEVEKQQDKKELEEEGDHAEKERKEEREEVDKFLQSPQQAESAAELPLDSVAIIRDLVTEITEVETIVYPSNGSTLTDMLP